LENLLWVERYRPQTVSDCILPDYLKVPFQNYVDKQQIPNLLLCGGPGMGKTTIAKAMCKEIGLDYIVINGSQESGIDLLRVKLENYCSSVSLRGGRKVVILDEGDYLNPQSTQPAMRGFIERYAENASFIITANYLNRIIDPIHSRCSVVDFRINKKERPAIAQQFLGRITKILDENNVKYNEKVIIEVILRYFPDFRRIINEFQKYSAAGNIDVGIFDQFSDTNFKALIQGLKDKKFQQIRKWVADNSDNDPKLIYRKIYDNISEYVKPQSLPGAILLLADYQYKSAFVADQEINLTACLIELMVDCDWS
jgi:DNA polymerase III delta prime subunit